MINGNPVNSLLKGLTLISQSSDTLSLKAGTVLEAKVIAVTEEGNPVLRLMVPGSNKEKIFEALIKQDLGISFKKGQTIVIEIVGGKKDINAKILSILDGKSGKAEIPQKAGLAISREMLTGSVGTKSKVTNSDSGIPLNKLKPITDKLITDSNKEILTLVSTSGKAVSLKAGSIIKARVSGVTDDGNTVLRLIMPAGKKGNEALRLIAPDIKKGNVELTIIKTVQDSSLKKGDNIFLKILGGRKNIRAEVIESFRTPSGVQQDVPLKFLEMLADSSGSKLTNSELKLFLNMIKSFPGNVKASMPEIKVLEKTLHNIKQLNGRALKTLIKTSGVAYETRLKAAIMNRTGTVSRRLPAFQSEGDLKGLLLRIKVLLNERSIINDLEKAGFKVEEIADLAERSINNIEFYQMTSKINDMFYTFLPIFFTGFRNSEFLFKKSIKNGKESSTYDINLDLEKLGKLSVSIALINKGFHVTFFAEREEVKKLINSQMQHLKERFLSQGLSLKTLHINQKNIVFGQSQYQGISFRV